MNPLEERTRELFLDSIEKTLLESELLNLEYHCIKELANEIINNIQVLRGPITQEDKDFISEKLEL